MTLPTIYDGLRGYWGFDEGSGTTAADATHLRPATVPSDAWSGSGKFGGALAPASSAEFAAVSGAGEDLNHNFTSVSAQGWVNLSTAPASMWGSAHNIITKDDGGSGFSLGFLTGTADVSFRIYNQAGTPYTATYTETATSGWVHYVGVYTPTAVLLYRNGVEVATAVADGTLRKNPAIDIKIGEGFQGLLDEVALWARMLSSTEVTALYNAGAGARIALMVPYAKGTPVEDYAASVVFGRRELDPATDTYPDALSPDKIVASLSSVYSTSLVAVELYTTSAFSVKSTPFTLQDPALSITSVGIVGPWLGELVGQIQPVPWGWLSWWWDFLSPDGFTFEYARNDKDYAFGAPNVITTAVPVPLNVSFQYWRVRLTVETWDRDIPRQRRWSTDWWELTGAGWSHVLSGGLPMPPLKPGIPGPDALATSGKPGPGVYRQRLLDFSLTS